jgi:ankyrin repeat protein
MAAKAQLLCEAVELEDRVLGMALVEKLLAEEVDPNAVGSHGEGPLHVAIWAAHWEAVSRLLDAGAWLRIDREYELLACWALAQAPDRIIERLLAGGMIKWDDLVEAGGEEDLMYENPIVDLLQESRYERLEWLWHRGLDRLKEAVDPDLGWTPLIYMAAKNDLPGAAWLIARGADVNRRGEASNGYTALDHAVMDKNSEMVDLLIKTGANPNIPTWMWQTAAGRLADDIRKLEPGSPDHANAMAMWSVVEPAARRFPKPVYPDGSGPDVWPPVV